MSEEYPQELLKRAKVIYVSGPISGRVRSEAQAHFDRVADFLCQTTSARIINPMDSESLGTWEENMRRDLHWLLDCDTIFLLEGWEDSNGAKLEHHIAQKLNFLVVSEDQI